MINKRRQTGENTLYARRSSSNDSAPPSPESKISCQKKYEKQSQPRKTEGEIGDYIPFPLIRPIPTKSSTKEADGPAPLTFTLP